MTILKVQLHRNCRILCRLKQARAFLCRVVLFLCMTSFCLGADMARCVWRDKNGEYEEGSFEGTILVEQCDQNAVKMEMRDRDDGETYVKTFPAESVLWLQFQDAPVELATARVEVEVGAYREALDKLGEIDVAQIDSAAAPMILQEIAWYKAYAATELARAQSGKISDGGRALDSFVKENPNHYRYYEAAGLLADVLATINKPELARAKYEVLQGSDSKTYQARGKLGLAQLALTSNQLDDARALFQELADDQTLDEKLEGFDARVVAKIGLARVLSAQGEFEQARDALNVALQATPNSATRQQATIYNALGETCAAAERYEEAILAYLHVDLLYPTARVERVEALQALTKLWRQVGRDDRAQETAERLRTRFQATSE